MEKRSHFYSKKVKVKEQIEDKRRTYGTSEDSEIGCNRNRDFQVRERHDGGLDLRIVVGTGINPVLAGASTLF